MNENNEQLRQKTLTGFVWMFSEKIGAQLVNFIVSMVLARLLMPEDYGVIALVGVFFAICNVFVDGGFGSALIQKKDADDLDFSSVFYFSMSFSILLYIAIYFFAPYIAKFYGIDVITPVVRVMGLRLIVGSFSGIQKAYVSRTMQFKKFFWSTLLGTVISAVVGITMAYMGYGVWALVWQGLTNATIDMIVVRLTIKWRPKKMFSFLRLKTLISYGWKVLVGSLIDTLYNDFRSLYIGKLYTTEDLAFYSKGKHFPDLVVANVNSSIQSVLFPAMSKKQDNKEDIKAITRRSIKTSAYVMLPLLVGLAAVGEPLIRFLLTEKWLPCVPFLQILCFNAALQPIQSANLQGIYAMGRSDIALKLNIIKKVVGFLVVLFAARISVLAMAYAGIGTAIFCSVANAYPNKKLMNYSYIEQIKDIMPYILISLFMGAVVLAVELIGMPAYLTLIMQVIVGAVVYISLSVIFKIDSFYYILNIIKSLIKRK